jgi:hypothetical protein
MTSGCTSFPGVHPCTSFYYEAGEGEGRTPSPSKEERRKKNAKGKNTE